jgi:transcriptional regulator with XRE-family HTH domain
MSADSSKLKSLIESLFKAKGLTQKDVSESLKITPITLNRYFRSDSELRADTFVGMLKLIDINLIKICDETLNTTLQSETENVISPADQLYNAITSLDRNNSRILIEFLDSFLKAHLPMEQSSKINLKKSFNLD